MHLCVCVCVSRVGQNHMYVRCIYAIFAGNSPNIQSYMVFMYRVGQNRVCTLYMTECMVISQRGSTEEMPENAHFCIQKAATHSHFIQTTPF